jgi:DNA modification methylase
MGSKENTVQLVWPRRETPTSPAVLHRLSETRPSAEKAGSGTLYLGDNLAVMQALLPTFEGRINLIYADPPLNTGRAYSSRIGAGEDSRRPSAWKTAPSYEDRWAGRPDYLDMLAPRLEMMHRLLAPTGTFYLHVDWRASGLARMLLDQLFGPERLLNEIVWVYHGPSPIQSAFKRKHDTLLVYTKSRRYTFNADAIRVPYDAATVKAFASSERAGFGKTPDLERGKVPEDWWYFPVVARLHKERTGYPTQKPVALLERIVRASSHEGDLVADFFAGSGTTAIAAARSGRRWLLCDRSPLAVATAYRRLLQEHPSPSVEIQATRRPPRSAGLARRLQWKRRRDTLEVRLRSVRIRGQARQPWGEISLWEVDWDAGEGFQSRSRSVRPWRSERLNRALRHRYSRPGVYRVRVRAWDNLGRIYTAERKIKVPG